MAITNFASKVFGDSGGGTLRPRQKFNFAITFFMAGVNPVTFYQIQDVTSPSFSFDTVILNQYNVKRVIQTRMNYDPVNITFYDTFDNAFSNIMKNYIRHYFNSDAGIDEMSILEGTNTINANFASREGFTPPADGNKVFFTKIEIAQPGHQGQYKKTILVNPVITAIQSDTLSYSDSSPVTFTVTMQPEKVMINHETSTFDDNLNT